MRRRIPRLPLVLLAALLGAGTAAASSSGGAATSPSTAEARLTAVTGTASYGNAPMSRTSELGDETTIATGEDGNATMLVDQDNIVQLCSATKMKLKRHPGSGGRVIEVGSGTTRIIVDPASSNEPLQISTPAAIATIMGTVVYVTVDPVTGETTIASEDHQVRIESSDPNVAGSTVINGEEQITLRPGQAPTQKPQRVAKSVLENQSGCLKDIYRVALGFDRGVAGNNSSNRLAAVDGGIVDLPVVGLEGDPLQVEDPAGEQGLEDPSEVIEPFDIVDPPGSSDDDLDFPDPCGGIPGDGCFPFPGNNEDF